MADDEFSDGETQKIQKCSKAKRMNESFNEKLIKSKNGLMQKDTIHLLVNFPMENS